MVRKKCLSHSKCSINVDFSIIVMVLVNGNTLHARAGSHCLLIELLQLAFRFLTPMLPMGK